MKKANMVWGGGNLFDRLVQQAEVMKNQEKERELKLTL